MMRVYEVREQWPHREVASFKTLEDAMRFICTDGWRFALPIITSRIQEGK